MTIAKIAFDEVERQVLGLRFGRKRLSVWEDRWRSDQRVYTLGKIHARKGRVVLSDDKPRCVVSIALNRRTQEASVGIGVPEDRSSGGWFASYIDKYAVLLADPLFFEKVVSHVQIRVEAVAG